MGSELLDEVILTRDQIFDVLSGLIKATNGENKASAIALVSAWNQIGFADARTMEVLIAWMSANEERFY